MVGPDELTNSPHDDSPGAGGTVAPPTSPGVPSLDVPSPDEVRRVLATIDDPELGVDIVTLGMVDNIDVSPDGTVTVGIKLTIGGCPLRADIKRSIESRVEVHPGVSKVRIDWGEMTSDERSQVMQTARWKAREHAPETAIPAACQVVGVGSGKGGVGKSSVTVNLAVAIAQMGYTVGLLDADIWGFSVPRLLGIHERLEAQRVPGSDRPKIVPNTRQVGIGRLEVVSTGFLVEESTALMWRGLMLTKAVEQFLTDVAWGDLDYLLIDLPPGTGDVQMGLARLLPQTSMVIVTTPASAAQTVAQRAADMARRSFLPVVGVVENMSAFVCEHGTSYPLFGSGGGQTLADAIDAPLLGQVPLEPAVAAGNDAGVPVVVDGDGRAAREFRSIAERLVNELVPPKAADEAAGCGARLLDAVAAAFDKIDTGITEGDTVTDGVAT